MTRKCHAQFWIGGGESDLSADHTYHRTLSGVPQGGIISPLLANILLNELDTFVETVLIPRHTKGTRRKENPEYHRLISRSWLHRKRGNVEGARELKKQAQKLPSKKMDDPNYRRLTYIRYADDFLLGFIGPREEAEEIKRQLRAFLHEELKLELSEEKTLITHARSEAARFLGYEVTTMHDDTKHVKRRTNGTERASRSINGVIGLRVPRDVIEEQSKRYMRSGTAVHRKELEGESDYAIVTRYQLEFRGLANYYRLAYNLSQLTKLKWVMEISLTKTLASKHRIRVTKVYEKYGATLREGNQEYKGLRVVIPRQDKQPLVATWGGISLKWDSQATLDDQPPQLYSNRSELVQRLLADFCELCGRDKDVEIHHVRAMKKLHEYPGRVKPEWVKRMIALKRKTIVLCKRCHEATDHGLPITWQLMSLDEIKDRRKRSITPY